VCHTYLRDVYGAMADGLNAGLPSDRLEMEWWIESERVERRIVGHPPELLDGPVLQVNATHLTRAGLVAPGRLILEAGVPVIRIEIPADYQAIKAADPALAREWRLGTRQLFERYFAAGYTVVDFASHPVDGVRRSYYLLSTGGGPSPGRM
jgi:predicted GNAT superfamily acetyltransferase